MQGVRRAIRLLRPPSYFETSNPCTDFVNSRTSALQYGFCTLQGGGEETKQQQKKKEPQELYDEITNSLENKVLPYPSTLQELIRSSSTASEVSLATRAAELLQTYKQVELRERKTKHTKEVTHMMVAAYLRANDSHNALKLLSRENPSFVSSIGSAHLLLKYSKSHRDVSLMHRILRSMKANDIRATQTTADIILRQCKEAGESELMFTLARSYIKQGLTFHESLFDVLISSAANAGDSKLVFEIQGWREKQSLVHTTASAVSLAKALVLDCKLDAAALVIRDHCSDREKRDRYLSIMVKVWPLQLMASRNLEQEKEDEYLQKLKADVISFFECLKGLGLEFSFDVGNEFAKGKGSDSKAQKEVKSVALPPQSL